NDRPGRDRMHRRCARDQRTAIERPLPHGLRSASQRRTGDRNRVPPGRYGQEGKGRARPPDAGGGGALTSPPPPLSLGRHWRYILFMNAPDKLAIAVAQLNAAVGDIAGNIDKARRARREAAAAGADIV